jgi:hypothetical protein
MNKYIGDTHIRIYQEPDFATCYFINPLTISFPTLSHKLLCVIALRFFILFCNVRSCLAVAVYLFAHIAAYC